MFIRNVLVTAVSAATLGLTGCLDSGGQTSKNANPEYIINGSQTVKGTHPLFDPLETEFVIPSDALFGLSEVDDGTMLNGTDPANPVTQGLGYMDGASVLAPIDIQISASLDAQQVLDARGFVEVDGKVVPNPDQNVFLIPVEYASGDTIKALNAEAPGLTPAARYREALRLEASGGTNAQGESAADIFSDLLTEKVRVELLDINGGQNNLIRVLPITPLDPKTQYILAVTNDIVDANGEPLVGSPTYQSVADPERILSNGAFGPFRDAMLPARQLAADFFDFKREYAESADFSATFDDVTYSTAITTTAVEDVLLANAAPITYFRPMLEIEQRKEELVKLVNGFYNLSDQPLAEGATTAESNLNSAIYTTLTDTSFRLYDEALATILTDANASGTAVVYSDVVADEDADRRMAHAIQVAAAEAVYSDDFATFKADIDAQATAMADAAKDLLDTPKPRDVRVFSQRDGGDVNGALAQNIAGTDLNIHVYEGTITLPYYLAVPEEDGSVIQSENWTSADFSSSELLADAPSDRVTYRFPFAKKTADTTVPLVIAAPDTDNGGFNTLAGPAPADGYPVIIYQHAATQDRSAILTMATAAGLTCASPDNPSASCFVTIGIDQPLHGIFDRIKEGTAENPEPEDGAVGLNPISEQKDTYGVGSNPDQVPFDATERHFGFTVGPDRNAVTPSELAAPKAVADDGGPASGSLFLNFTNYANTRDNMRQGAMDLLNLNASLDNIQAAITACFDAPGDACPSDLNIDTSQVYFMTHSLSGMGGAAFHHVNNAAIAADAGTSLKPVEASIFFNTGGQFTRVAENSKTIAVENQLLPILDEASDGVLAQGRIELDLYFNIFQGLLDSADPAAFAPLYDGQKVLLTEIVGTPNDPEKPTDGTIPNAADEEGLLPPLETTIAETGFEIKGENMPLAGTEPMASVMGAAGIQQDAVNNTLPVITRYTEGAHGNPISAGTDAEEFSSRAVFDEMVFQMLELFTSGTVSVNDGCVVKDVTCGAEGGGGGGGGGGDTVIIPGL